MKEKNNSISWKEDNGIIYLSLISYGRSSQKWLEYFARNNTTLDNYFKDHLYPRTLDHRLCGQERFIPTLGIKYEIALVKGGISVASSRDRTTRKIREKNPLLSVSKNLEVLCLLSENLLGEDFMAMGLKRIFSFDTDLAELEPQEHQVKPFIHELNYYRKRKRLYGTYDHPDSRTYKKNDGFLFVLSKEELPDLNKEEVINLF